MMNHLVTRTIAIEPTPGPIRTVKLGDVMVSGPAPSEAEDSLRISADQAFVFYAMPAPLVPRRRRSYRIG